MNPGSGLLLVLLAATVSPAVAAGPTDARPPRDVELMELDILRLDLDSLTVLDIRSFPTYREGHIPRSFPVDVALLQEAVLNGPTPDPAGVLKALGDAPLMTDRAVVIYDASLPGRNDGWVAWLLSYAGVEEVNILDGGFAAWNRRKLLGVFRGYPLPIARMQLRAEGLTPRLHLRVDPARLAGEAPDDAAFVTVMPAGSQHLSAGQIAVHEVLDERQFFLFPSHLETLLKSRGLDPEKRMILTGEPADMGLVWAALVGNGFEAGIVMGVSPQSPQPPAP
ncbi:MAG: hypothetical protein E2P03_08195 [Acidobacteria bacterium]|nr:MAG: hypothetical protein E2P03_08195 [Acidobacteriota bacterium]